MSLKNNTYRLHIGTYAPKEEPGIFIYDFHAEQQKFELKDRVSGVEKPSFLTLDRNGEKLYAISEIEKYEGGVGGPVTAYSIEKNGKINYLNELPSLGEWPCHLMLHKDQKLLFLANYLGGSIGLFALHEDGSLKKMTDKIQHEGKGTGGTRMDRQERPHPHAVFLDPNHRFAIVPDLGLDKILVYLVDTDQEKLELHDQIQLQQTAGPRHFAFHPSGNFAFSINELDSTITAFSYDDQAGKLTPIQTISTLPKDFKGESDCADIHIDPTGQFIYGSNRGHDSIAVFSIDSMNGYLTRIDCTATQGKTPRNFAISPDGAFLFAANQDSNSVVVFHRNQLTGKLSPTGALLELYKPVCIKIRM